VRQERIAERALTKAIKAMVDDLANRYSIASEAANLQIVSDHQPAIADALTKTLKQTALIFGGRTLDRLEVIMGKGYAPGLSRAAGAGMEIKSAREIFEQATIQWALAHGLARAVTVTGTLKGAVRRVIAAALADGLGEAGAVAAIRERIGKVLSRTNAARIARTEMHTASTIGSDMAARSTGLDMIKEWMAAEDNRTRASHADADGQEVPLDEAFQVGSSNLMVPGDPNGPAGEVINCRCAVLHHPVIGGEVIR
jgi:hypothetical protein